MNCGDYDEAITFPNIIQHITLNEDQLNQGRTNIEKPHTGEENRSLSCLDQLIDRAIPCVATDEKKAVTDASAQRFLVSKHESRVETRG